MFGSHFLMIGSVESKVSSTMDREKVWLRGDCEKEVDEEREDMIDLGEGVEKVTHLACFAIGESYLGDTLFVVFVRSMNIL